MVSRQKMDDDDQSGESVFKRRIVSTPAKRGGVKKMKKFTPMRGKVGLNALNVSLSARKRMKLQLRRNTSLNNSKIIKEAINLNNRAMMGELRRIQNEIRLMTIKCDDLEEENDNVVCEIKMLNNVVNLHKSEDACSALVNMRTEAYMSVLVDEIGRRLHEVRESYKAVKHLVNNPDKIMRMPVDLQDDDDITRVPYMERLQLILSNEDEIESRRHGETEQTSDLLNVSTKLGRGNLGLPQRIPLTTTENSEDNPINPKVDTTDLVFDETLENGLNEATDDTCKNPTISDSSSNITAAKLIQLASEPADRAVFRSPKCIQNQRAQESTDRAVFRSPKCIQNKRASKSTERAVFRSPNCIRNPPQDFKDDGCEIIEDVTVYLNTDMEMTAVIDQKTSSDTEDPQISDQTINEKTVYMNSDMEMTTALDGSDSFSIPVFPRINAISSLKKISNNENIRHTNKFGPENLFGFELETPKFDKKMSKPSELSKIEKFERLRLEQSITIEIPVQDKSPDAKSQSRSKSRPRSKKTQDNVKHIGIFSSEPSEIYDVPLKSDSPKPISNPDSDGRLKNCGRSKSQSRSKSRGRSKPKIIKNAEDQVDDMTEDSEPCIVLDHPNMYTMPLQRDSPSPKSKSRLQRSKSQTRSKSRSRSKPKPKNDSEDQEDEMTEDSEPCIVLDHLSKYTVPLQNDSPSPKSKSRLQRSKSQTRSKSRSRPKSKPKNDTEEQEDKMTKDSEPCVVLDHPSKYTVPLKKDTYSPKTKPRSQRSKSTKGSETNKDAVDLIDDLTGDYEPCIVLDPPSMYTVSLKTASPSPKSKSRSQSRGRSKSKRTLPSEKQEQIKDADSSETADSNRYKRLQSKGKSEAKLNLDLELESSEEASSVEDAMTRKSDNVYTVPLKKDSPSPKSKTISQSRGRSRSKTLPAEKHKQIRDADSCEAAESLDYKRSQSKGRSKAKKKLEAELKSPEKTSSVEDTKTLEKSDNVYTVPLKNDSPSPKSKARSQSRGRSRSKKTLPAESADSSETVDSVGYKRSQSKGRSSAKKNLEAELKSPEKASVKSDNVYSVPLKTGSPKSKIASRGRSSGRGRTKNQIDNETNSSPGNQFNGAHDQKDLDDHKDDHEFLVGDEDDFIPCTQVLETKTPTRLKMQLLVIDTDDEESEKLGEAEKENSNKTNKRKSHFSNQSTTKKRKSIESIQLMDVETLVVPDSTKKPKVKDDVLVVEDQEDNGIKRARRTKGCVSYKEKSLNCKMRKEVVNGKIVEAPLRLSGKIVEAPLRLSEKIVKAPVRLSEQVRVSSGQPFENLLN